MIKFFQWAFDLNTPDWVRFSVVGLGFFTLLVWGSTVAALLDFGMYWRGFVVLLTPPLLLARAVWIAYRNRGDHW